MTPTPHPTLSNKGAWVAASTFSETNVRIAMERGASPMVPKFVIHLDLVAISGFNLDSMSRNRNNTNGNKLFCISWHNYLQYCGAQRSRIQQDQLAGDPTHPHYHTHARNPTPPTIQPLPPFYLFLF